MPHAYDVLTPDSLAMLQVISETGSFAAAARHLGLVPSALTYWNWSMRFMPWPRPPTSNCVTAS